MKAKSKKYRDESKMIKAPTMNEKNWWEQISIGEYFAVASYVTVEEWIRIHAQSK